MEQQTVRKTFKYKLKPTPKQERELGRVLGLCRWLYNTALEQRIIAWQRARVSVSRYQQEAELKDIRAAFPEYAAIHSPCLARCAGAARQDVSGVLSPGARRERKQASRAIRRVPATTPSPTRSLATARRWTTASWSSPRLGASPCAGLARWRARPRRSRSAGKRMAGMSASPAPMCRYSPCRRLDRRRALTLGIEAFATLSDGTRIFSPGWYRKAERALKTAQRRVSRRKKGSNRRRKAVTLLAKAHQKVRRQRQDFHHKTALALGARATTRSITKTCRRPTWSRTTISPRASSDAGWSAFLSILELQGSMRRSLSGRRAACLHQPDVFWLWRRGPEGLIRPLASLPGLWNEPASGPQRGQEHRAGSGRAFGEAWRWPRRRTENPSGFSPCGVSTMGYRERCLGTGETSLERADAVVEAVLRGLEP